MSKLKQATGSVERKTKGRPSSVDVHVGQRLRTRRSLLGLSQTKLAEEVGLTFQQIQKYEKGMNRVSAGRLYQFSKILEVPISFFFENLGLSDNDQEKFVGEDLMQNKETLDLIRTYYSIPDIDMRKDVFKFVSSIAKRKI